MKKTKITKPLVRGLILKRKPEANKSDFGHALIIAGSRGLTGAAVICANGCIRSGAGLVTVGVPKSQQPIVAKNVFQEVMTLPLEETNEGTLSVNAYKHIKKFISKRKISVIAVGPGLSTHKSTQKFVKLLIKQVNLPLVLDADGLNALSETGTRNLEIKYLKNSEASIIATPHPGELSRLAGVPKKEILKNDFEITCRFAGINGIICVLKKHGTIISDGVQAFFNTTGNPGMATGGCGDMLTGMIAAFIPQVKGSSTKEKLLNAAIVSVYLHGLTGDLGAREKTQISLLPGDMIEKIPEAIKRTLN